MLERSLKTPAKEGLDVPQRRFARQDLGGILQLALAVSLRNKSLWAWALISALPSAVLQYATTEVTRNLDRSRVVFAFVAGLEPSWLAIGILGAFALLLLAVFAEGGLISGADAAMAGQGSILSIAWKAALSRIRALIALRVLLFMGIVAYFAPLLVFLLYIGANGASDSSARAPQLVVGAGLLWLLGLIPALLWWYGVTNYAIRACVLRGEGSISAIAMGFRVLKGNLRTSLVATVVAAAGQMLFGLAFTGGLLVLVRPLATLAGVLDNTMGRVLTVGVAVFFMIQALAIGLAQVTFVQVFWTAVYQSLSAEAADDLHAVGEREQRLNLP